MSPCSHMCHCLSRWHHLVQITVPLTVTVGAMEMTSWAKPTCTSGDCNQALLTRTLSSCVSRKLGYVWVGFQGQYRFGDTGFLPDTLILKCNIILLLPHSHKVSQQPLLKKFYLLLIYETFTCFFEESQDRAGLWSLVYDFVSSGYLELMV